MAQNLNTREAYALVNLNNRLSWLETCRKGLSMANRSGDRGRVRVAFECLNLARRRVSEARREAAGMGMEA